MDSQEMLKLRRVAKMLDMHYQTVWRLVKEKKLPAVKIAGSWRVRQEDLDKYLNENSNK